MEVGFSQIQSHLQMRGLFYKPYEPILSIARPDTVLRLQYSVECNDLPPFILIYKGDL